MAVLAGAAVWCLAVPAAPEVVEVGLEVVGHTDLGAPGTASSGDVAAAGTTVVVASQGTGPGCPPAELKVVDVRDRRRPSVAASVALPAGRAAADLDPAGDLLAVALGPPCAGAAGGPDVLYYDLAAPGSPRLAGSSAHPPGTGSVALAPGLDGRMLALTATAGPRAEVAVDDVTDATRPATIGRWALPQVAGGCPGAVADLSDDGQSAVVAGGDGRIHQLDLSDPAGPSAAGQPAPGPAPMAVAVLPVGRRTLALVTEAPAGSPCAGDGGAGIRVVELGAGAGPVEVEPVRFPGPAGPGRLVASGGLAYVAWGGDGLRVVDFGEVRPRTVARFVPEAGDVVGVDLLPDHVVVTTRSAGLFVLERPEEGKDHGFWSQVGGALPYLGIMAMAGAIALFFAKMRAPAAATGHAPVPGPVRRTA